MIKEMDGLAQDPKNHVPVLMVPKAARYPNATIKNDPTTNLENLELLTPEIKIEPKDIVQIDD